MFTHFVTCSATCDNTPCKISSLADKKKQNKKTMESHKSIVMKTLYYVDKQWDHNVTKVYYSEDFTR